MLHHLALVASALTLAGPLAAQPIELSYMPSGAQNKLGYYKAQTLTLSTDRPAGLKKAPEAVEEALRKAEQGKAPKFGVLKLGPTETPTSFFIALLEDESGKSELFVDENADGDLTNDAAPTWNTVRYSGPGEGVTLDRRVGHSELQLPLGDSARLGRVCFYKLDLKDPNRKDARNQLFYYRDYGYEGSVKLGQYPYKVFLSDERTTGDFIGTPKRPSGAKLYIDINGNNRFDRVSEAFDVGAPFAVGDVTYSIQNLTASGRSFEVVAANAGIAKPAPTGSPTDKPADAAPAAKPALTVGTIAPAFVGKDLEGKELRFPDDYKGKVVLIDFWATWCPPCRDEIPNIVTAYEKFHARGLEIVSISLDRREGEQTLRDYVANNKMTWRQVYDGGHWQAAIAKQYGVNSIPLPLLVDGDTGKIIAAKSLLRGARLQGEIEKAIKSHEKK